MYFLINCAPNTDNWQQRLGLHVCSVFKCIIIKKGSNLRQRIYLSHWASEIHQNHHQKQNSRKVLCPWLLYCLKLKYCFFITLVDIKPLFAAVYCLCERRCCLQNPLSRALSDEEGLPQYNQARNQGGGNGYIRFQIAYWRTYRLILASLYGGGSSSFFFHFREAEGVGHIPTCPPPLKNGLLRPCRPINKNTMQSGENDEYLSYIIQKTELEICSAEA